MSRVIRQTQGAIIHEGRYDDVSLVVVNSLEPFPGAHVTRNHLHGPLRGMNGLQTTALTHLQGSFEGITIEMDASVAKSDANFLKGLLPGIVVLN